MPVACFAISSCTAASPDSARDAYLQIPNAQWRPGPLPDPAGGPAIVELQGLRPTVIVPIVDEPLRGAAEPATTAVAVMLEGDAGAWLYPAMPPSADLPTSPSFSTRFGLAADLPLGPIELVAVAFDGDGRAGPAARLPLIALADPPPTGELVIGLVWTGPADLDLHVVDPLGGEAWSGDPNTWEPPPPGMPVDPDAWRTGGILDHDANAACDRDGHPAEHVAWMMPPPAGEYLVRVDTRALCGAPTATWAVAVYRADGSVLAAARGTSLPDDVLAPHSAGAGVLALRFTLP